MGRLGYPRYARKVLHENCYAVSPKCDLYQYPMIFDFAEMIPIRRLSPLRRPFGYYRDHIQTHTDTVNLAQLVLKHPTAPGFFKTQPIENCCSLIKKTYKMHDIVTCEIELKWGFPWFWFQPPKLKPAEQRGHPST